MNLREKLLGLYETLFDFYGPQNWWPGETADEIVIGAILTQNTSWRNVERGIANLKENGRLNIGKIAGMNEEELAQLIRPAGYFRLKSRRLISTAKALTDRNGPFWPDALMHQPIAETRPFLLSVKGVGPETADSILLYVGNRPTFVIDAYTRRIAARIGIKPEKDKYEDWRSLMMANLPKKADFYNEFHALLVAHGNRTCLKRKPKCGGCPVVSCDFHITGSIQ